jgi:hypothetical protein
MTEIVYTPDYVRNTLTVDQQKQIYRRYRKAANARLARIKKTEFINSEFYQRHKKPFPAVSEVSEKNLPYLLTDVADFLDRKNTTLRYQRALKKSNLKSFRASGLDIEESDYWDFVNFLNAWHDKNLESLYGSERVYEVLEDAKEKKLKLEDIKDNFEDWLKNEKKLSKIKLVKGKDSDYYLRKLENDRK